jgi:hypothetical protein
MFDCSTDVLGVRNLLLELGHLQEAATVIYQDNKSAIQIATNRGSLGKTSRAMDLQTLSIRNRIEDHQVFPSYCKTTKMLADMGSQALSESPFVQFRDIMNGYALVKAHHPDKLLPDYVFDIRKDPDVINFQSDAVESISTFIMSFEFHQISPDVTNGGVPTHEDDDDLPDEVEEEEEDDDDDSMDSNEGEDTSDDEPHNNDVEANHQSDDEINIHGDNQSIDDDAVIPMPCYALKLNGFCKWGATCRFQHLKKNVIDEKAGSKSNDKQSSDINNDDDAEMLDKYVTFTHDILPQEQLGGYSPYEIRTGKQPDNTTTFRIQASTPSYQRRKPLSEHHAPPNQKRQPIMRMRGGSDDRESVEDNIHDDESSLEEDGEYNINHSTNPRPAYSPIHDLFNQHISRNVNDGGVSSSPYSFNMNHYPGQLWENDDLPDPRLYNIDIGLMRHWHIRDRVDTTRLSQMTYHSYHRYLQEIEPGYYGDSVLEETNKFTISTVIQHLPTADSVSRNMPSPVMFCPPVLDSDPIIRSRQIQRALNKFIIRLESLIENKSIDEVTDNIYWGLFIPNPIPKRSWLRWIRWRTYYNHLTFSNTIDGTNTTELECPEYGPAFLRPVDKRRMLLHNCFSLDTHTAQFYHLGGCCKENSRPPEVRHVDQDKVIIYTNASIWRLGQDDYIDSTYLVHKPEAFRGATTWRQKRLNTYFKQLNPEWGRWAKEVKEINPYQSASKRLKTKE